MKERVIVKGILVGLTFILTWVNPVLSREQVAQETQESTIVLPDIVLGAEDAPVTVIEYFSLDCNHCAEFHEKVFPVIKRKFIDTGLVRFIIRDFPLDEDALLASQIAWCRGKENYLSIVGHLLSQQQQWVGQENCAKILSGLAEEKGINDFQCQSCLQNQRLADAILTRRLNVQKELEIDHAPAFVINGKLHPDILTVKDLAKVVKKHKQAQ